MSTSSGCTVLIPATALSELHTTQARINVIVELLLHQIRAYKWHWLLMLPQENVHAQLDQSRTASLKSSQSTRYYWATVNARTAQWQMSHIKSGFFGITRIKYVSAQTTEHSIHKLKHRVCGNHSINIVNVQGPPDVILQSRIYWSGIQQRIFVSAHVPLVEHTVKRKLG